MSLESLLEQRPDLWRGRGLSTRAPAGVPTGFAALDQLLPWHGWPPASLSEVLTAQPGAGLALLLPMLIALGRVSSERQPRWLLLVDPPFIPYGPALVARGLDLERLVVVRAAADGPWVMEQALRSGACALVLGWASESGGIGTAVLRRLQLAAGDGDTPLVLLRPPAAAEQASPAAFRVAVQMSRDGLDVTLLKLRGGRAGMTVHVDGYRVAGGERIGGSTARAGA